MSTMKEIYKRAKAFIVSEDDNDTKSSVDSKPILDIEDDAIEVLPVRNDENETAFCQPEACSVDEYSIQPEVDSIEETERIIAPEASNEDVLQALKSLAEVIASQDSTIQDLLKSSSESDHQAETLRTMSSRVKAYEEEFVQNSILKPIINDFILLFDSISSAGKWLRSCEDQDDWRSVFTGVLDGIKQELVDTMKRHGLSAMQDTGAILDPSVHKVVRVIRKEAVRDREIAERVRTGWMFNGRVVRPEEVAINRYTTERQV